MRTWTLLWTTSSGDPRRPVSSYFDTSALAKVHLREDGTDAVRQLVQVSTPAMTSWITLPELSSALHRALNRGVVPPESAEQVRLRMATLWDSLVRVPVSVRLVRAAEQLVWRYKLRAYDGIHLASALSVQGQLGESVEFVAFDVRLRSAAISEGLLVAPSIQR